MSNVGCMLGALHSYFYHVSTLMFNVSLNLLNVLNRTSKPLRQTSERLPTFSGFCIDS